MAIKDSNLGLTKALENYLVIKDPPKVDKSLLGIMIEYLSEFGLDN